MKVIIFQKHDDEIIALCKMYWQLESDSESFSYKVIDLAKKFNLSSKKISELVELNCAAYSSEKICANCFEPYQYKNRTNYSRVIKSFDNSSFTCEKCLNQQKQMEDEQKRKRLSFILDHLSWEHPITVDKLCPIASILLFSFIRFGINEDLSFIQEYSILKKVAKLFPDSEKDVLFIDDFYEQNIITISPFSDLNAIRLEEDGTISYCLEQVRWSLPIQKDISSKDFVRQLNDKIVSIEFLEEAWEEVLSLCQKIALLECLAYFKYQMAEYRFNFSPGEKTKLLFKTALEKFSVSQIYNLIWSATKNAAAYYMKEGIAKQRAANSVVGAFERLFERAVAEGWELQDFNRISKLPQSVVSKIIYNKILGENDAGFHFPLSHVEEIIKKRLFERNSLV